MSHTICTVEDFHLPLWEKVSKFEQFDKVLAVVRSPRNWLASSIACMGVANDYLDVVPENIRQLPVSRIDAYKGYFLDKIIMKSVSRISYNMWLDNDEYRRQKACEFGIKETGVPDQCKFSSFKRPYGHNGDRRRFLNRKQKCRFDRLYDKDLQYIQGQYFE
jgi:hypothetical protein